MTISPERSHGAQFDHPVHRLGLVATGIHIERATNAARDATVEPQPIDARLRAQPQLIYAVEGQYRATKIDLKEAFEAPQVFLAEAPPYGQ